MNGEFTLPDNCDYCHKKLDGKEIVVIADYKLYHPSCWCNFKNKSMLHDMFEKQRAFQRSLGIDPEKYDQQYVNSMILACMSELDEILMETPWKPWKKQQSFNKQNFKEELIDLFHFFLNLCMVSGMTPEELYDMYYVKMQKNQTRQKTGY